MMLLGKAGVELILATGYMAAHREMLKDFRNLSASDIEWGRSEAERLSMDRLREINKSLAAAHKGIKEIIERTI
jgi:hypothetical protein